MRDGLLQERILHFAAALFFRVNDRIRVASDMRPGI